jgi:hypothetical protein
MISAVVPFTIWFVNKQPTLEHNIRIVQITLGLAIITASRLAASAVRNKTPMFPSPVLRQQESMGC